MKTYQKETVEDLLFKIADLMKVVNTILNYADMESRFSDGMIESCQRSLFSERSKEHTQKSPTRSAINIIKKSPEGICIGGIIEQLKEQRVNLGTSEGKRHSFQSRLHPYIKKGTEIVKVGKLYFPVTSVPKLMAPVN